MDATRMNLENIKLNEASQSQTNTAWLHLFEWSKVDKHKNVACQGVQGGEQRKFNGKSLFYKIKRTRDQQQWA